MLCFKIHRRIFGSILFAVFFSALLYSPSYAISDYNGTFDATTFPFVLCYGSDTPSNTPQCSDYDTILFHITTSASSPSTARYFQIANGSNADVYTVNAVIDSSLDISSIASTTELRIINQYSFGSGRFDYTLTNTSSDCIVPSGTYDITENGTFDISSFSSVNVNVPSSDGTYHEDLTRIVRSIYVCAGVLLVLYFFYTIYRLIIRNSGVK